MGNSKEIHYPIETISLKEALQLVVEFGQTNTIMLGGEPGVGKTSGIKDIIKRTFGDTMRTLYFDCANMMVGEAGLPSFVEIDGKLQSTWAPNTLFGIHSKDPVCIVLDEYTKASEEVRNMFLPTIQERRVFSDRLPEGSIVTLTGNLEHERLGDRLEPHQLNRLTFVYVRKPTAKEWIWDWAVPNGIAPEILSWAEKDAAVFASYLDYPEGSNDVPAMIFNPHRPTKGAFVTPRSLARASEYVAKRDRMPSPEAFLRALEGTIGRQGAAALNIFIEIADKLPSDEAVVANPKRVAVPDGMVEQALLVMNTATFATPETMDARLDFMDRMPEELMAIFMKMVYSRDRKTFSRNERCKAYAGKFHWIL